MPETHRSDDIASILRAVSSVLVVDLLPRTANVVPSGPWILTEAAPPLWFFLWFSETICTNIVIESHVQRSFQPPAFKQ